MKISNVEIIGLESAIRASKLPMAIDADKLNSEITPTTIKLGSCDMGTGHNSFAKGIVVMVDIKAPQHFWLQFERYHFQDTISSQSTMHKIHKLDIDKLTTSRVAECTKDMIKDLVDLYSNYENKSDEDIKIISDKYGIPMKHLMTRQEVFYTIIENLPEGVELTRRVVLNYLQLRSMYEQRNTHKMYTWHIFCNWMKTLPEFCRLSGIK